MTSSDEDPICAWCQFKQSIKAHHPEDVELRADPQFGGVIVVVVDDRVLSTWRSLPIVCLCGQHV